MAIKNKSRKRPATAEKPPSKPQPKKQRQSPAQPDNRIPDLCPASRLPSEILLQIISQLDPADLKSAVLVCRRWRDVGEEPKLWSWAVLMLSSDLLLAATGDLL